MRQDLATRIQNWICISPDTFSACNEEGGHGTSWNVLYICYTIWLPSFPLTIMKPYWKQIRILELIKHIPRVPWCIANATEGFNPGEIRSIEHSLVQACSVVSIGVWLSDIGMATIGNKKALSVILVDHVPWFEACWSQFFAKFGWFVVLTSHWDA
jgi:hypothetical protein